MPRGQAAPQRFRHCLVGGLAVATPVHRVLLPASRGGPSEEHGLADPAVPAEQVEHGPVVQLRVVIVHSLRIAAVVPDYVGRDAFTEIGFECIDTLVQQTLQFPGDAPASTGYRGCASR